MLLLRPHFALRRSYRFRSNMSPKREMIEWPPSTGVGQTQAPSDKLHMIRAYDAAESAPPGGTDGHQPVVVFTGDASIGPQPERKLVERPAARVRRIIDILTIGNVH